MLPCLMLFDIDGTLVDTAGAGRLAIERACHAIFGADDIATRAANVPFAGQTDPTILAAVTRSIGISVQTHARYERRLRDRFLEELDREMQRSEPRRRILPGVPALLGSLSARAGVHLGLLTGNLEQGARTKLEPFGLNRYFAAGGFSSDHADRRMIARIARERVTDVVGIEFAPDHVTVIGDTEHDVDCARANGFRAVAVSTGWVPRRRLERARPDVLLDDFLDTDRVLEALLPH